MKITGTTTMHGPVRDVWAALTDPAVLIVAIPGCERLDPVGSDRYRFTIRVGFASIQGTYAGEVALSRLVAPSQQREPVSFVLTARGAGGPGTVATSIHVTLSPAAASTTELSYDADAEIAGMIASVGQRMLASIADRLIGEFFASVDRALTEPEAVSDGSVLTALPDRGRVPAAPPPAAPPTAAAFVGGALVGAAVTAAGVVASRLIGRRTR
jgi:carbon monoxide dehydrogenase subunit G